MYYVGADLHKEQTWFYVMDHNGDKILSKSISNNPEILHQFFRSLPRPLTLAVEATYNWYFFTDIAEQYAEHVYLANSYELKAFARRHKKTDKIDARLIADVLRKGYLPTVFIPNRSIREVKELLRYRINLVRDRCRNIFRLKNTLDKLGADSSGNFATEKQLKNIPVDSFPEHYRYIISAYIERIIFLSKKLYSVKIYLKDELSDDAEIRDLITVDGLDYFSAALVKSEIVDIERFRSFNRLCAFAGLAPRVAQSGNKAAYHGALLSNRRKLLQWILLETVFHFIKASPERKTRYENLKASKGANTAKIIMARQMLKVIYHVLKEKRPYYKEKPARPKKETNKSSRWQPLRSKGSEVSSVRG
ncbi:MAG: IS110 family transposase [Candidatus Omnitrophica bacterium]|nr:IS110 family transposase [Candidatus Omnitrophota bacterium]